MSRFDILMDRELPPEPAKEPEKPAPTKPSSFVTPGVVDIETQGLYNMVTRRDRTRPEYAQEYLGSFNIEPQPQLRASLPSGYQIAIPRDHIHLHQSRDSQGVFGSFELHIDIPEDIARQIISELNPRPVRPQSANHPYQELNLGFNRAMQMARENLTRRNSELPSMVRYEERRLDGIPQTGSSEELPLL